jgi:hypothetical protein
MVPEAGPRPRRARQLIPAGLPRRGELTAVGGIVIVLVHLVLAPLTLVLALAGAGVSKVSRWRLWWLLGPAAVGLIWVLAEGPGSALAGFAAGPAAALRDLGRGGHVWRPLMALDAERGSLAEQFPVALVIAAAEAALIGWLDWLHTDEWAVPPPRPGLVAAARRSLAARRIQAGAVLTRDGCALGVERATGAVAELRWAQALPGTLIVGASAQPVTVAGLQVVHAALRRRKPLIVLDPGGDGAIARAVAAACDATGAPLLSFAAPVPARSVIHSATAGVDNVATERTGTAADLARVIGERSAVLVPAGHAELAARACASLTSLAADLGRIGADGDALVWVPRAELLPVQALAPLLRDAATGGLGILIGTTSPAVAAELAGLVGTVVSCRLADQGLAATLSALIGTPSTAPATAATLAVPSAAPVRGPGPRMPASTLLALGDGEFVLAARSPRHRLIALGRLVPARLPSGARQTQEDDDRVALADRRRVAVDVPDYPGRTA